MNKKQQKVLIAGGALLALMGLFPPWIQTISSERIQPEKSVGYHLLEWAVEICCAADFVLEYPHV